MSSYGIIERRVDWWEEATTIFPSHLLSSQISQDIFLISTGKGENIVRLAQSSHAGHQYFRCLAELKRNTFKSEDDIGRRRIAMNMVSTICDTSHVHIFSVDNNDDWKKVNDFNETQMLFNKALNAYLLPTQGHIVSESRMKKIPPLSAYEIERNETTHDNKERRRTSILEAAESLLLVLHSAATTGVNGQKDQQNQKKKKKKKLCSTTSPSLPPKKRCRHADSDMKASNAEEGISSDLLKDNEIVNSIKDRENCVSDKKLLQTRQGMSINEITPNDVLCGGPNEGVLTNIRNRGNIIFHTLVDKMAEEFYSQGKNNKHHMLSVSQFAVKTMKVKNGSRFLVKYPKTGLWYEVSSPKAWSKACRTFMARSAYSSSNSTCNEENYQCEFPSPAAIIRHQTAKAM